MTTKNRQIKTGHDEKQEGMTLEALSDLKHTFTGRLNLKKGERVTMTRSEARRVMASTPGSFRVVLD